MTPSHKYENLTDHATDNIRLVPLSSQVNQEMPFSASSELISDLKTEHSSMEHRRHLPGHPRINLNDTTELTAFMLRELYAADLDYLALKMLVMTTESRSDISPLHSQLVKGRKICITEDPMLHLVWLNDRVFIKPIPTYLMSHSFWADYLLNESSPLGSSRKAICEASLGFLRSYYHLILHESDFDIACNQELRLLPPDVTWDQFCDFSKRFKDIEDCHVWRRYHYGELKMTTLSLYSKLFLRKNAYKGFPGLSEIYSSRFYAVLLFVFAAWSLVLGAMQVELGVEGLIEWQWSGFWTVCRWFSFSTLVGCIILALLLGILLASAAADKWMYALKSLYLNRKQNEMQTSKA